MSYLPHLLPVLCIFPFAFNKLSGSRAVYLLFLAPVAFLALTVLSFTNQTAIVWQTGLTTSFFSVGLKLDSLSGLIAAAVSTIGIVVARYSHRYLHDDPKKQTFFLNFAFTLSFVLSMLLAPNLLLLFLSWVGTSFFLHRLLVHFSERKAAIQAAQQKFWTSRLGDVFIVAAAVVLVWRFQTLEFSTLFTILQDPLAVKSNTFVLNLVSFFIVAGAMTKSAQFPFHNWLPNTMETPTPVSALMHAGIINAGGYLIIRLSPLLTHAPIALSFLAIAGAFTAFWASLVMLAQPNVKRRLAFSTISQMGFMMLQCGLGFFSVAVVHIIGHAFYKAYAFLSSGTAADYTKLNQYLPEQRETSNVFNMSILTVCFATLLSVCLAYLWHHSVFSKEMIVLLVILVLALTQVFLNTRDVKTSLPAVLSILGLYIFLSLGANFLLFSLVPNKVEIPGIAGQATVVVCSLFFLALCFIQNNLTNISNTKFGKKIYTKALRGAL